MRFAIRDLFWLTVIVAFALGWWLDHWRGRDEMRQMAESNAKLRYEARVAEEKAVLLQGMLIRQNARANGSKRLPSEDPFN